MIKCVERGCREPVKVAGAVCARCAVRIVNEWYARPQRTPLDPYGRARRDPYMLFVAVVTALLLTASCVLVARSPASPTWQFWAVIVVFGAMHFVALGRFVWPGRRRQ